MEPKTTRVVQAPENLKSVTPPRMKSSEGVTRMVPTPIGELPFLDRNQHPTVQPQFAKPVAEALSDFRKAAKRNEGVPFYEKAGPAFVTRAPIQTEKEPQATIDKILDAPVELTLRDLAGLSAEVREELRKLVSKKRVPVQEQMNVVVPDSTEIEPEREGCATVRNEDLFLDVNMLEAPTCQMTESTVGNIPAGSIICSDPVLQYYDSLAPGEEARKIVCARESQGLRSVYPKINGAAEIECILDGGSQIVSMSFEEAQRVGIGWDPGITIHMQSANQQLNQTCGLARNIPFKFGNLTLYLQIHVIKDPAYKVLLGRPFDCLTESVVENSKDGGQTITITDPNSGRKVTLPTFLRGHAPPSVSGKPEEGFPLSMN